MNSRTALVLALGVLLAGSGCSLGLFRDDPVPADGGDDGTDAEDGAGGVGITVEPTEGLTTTEGGGTATFTIVLDEEPTADVTIDLSSSDETEGTVSPESLTFTPDDWDDPQEVTVTGVDDLEVDGPQEFEIETAPAESGDDRYDGLDPDDVTVENTDDETPGITVEPTEGLSTSEGGGDDTFTVVLDAPPRAEVTIDLSSSDETEGTVSPESLTFTPGDWDEPQEVTVTGVDDDEVDGPQEYEIVTEPANSDDDNYDGLDADDVTVENDDDDDPGITVEPTEGLGTTEAGGSDQFRIVLDTRPTADVTIGLRSTDETEGTVSPDAVTFTADDWNVAQSVTVTGVDDDEVDGPQDYAVETARAESTDDDYDGMDAEDVHVTNTDDETPGITVEPTAGLVTTEAGGTAAFVVVLDSRPTAEVTIPLASSDEREGVAEPAVLAFMPDDWMVLRTVIVTGRDDDVDDGDVGYQVRTGPADSSDPDYRDLDAADVELFNTDDDTAGISVAPTGGLATTEGGGTATFTVVLDSRPATDVRIPLSSSDETEGTADKPAVLFPPDEWNVPRTVTVTGVDDVEVDGDVPYAIVTAPAESTDPNYAGLDAADVDVTNADDETAGITVTPTSGLLTAEDGTAAVFTVVLNTQPTATVRILLSSTDLGEGTAAPGELNFGTADWSVPQTVTVTGVDDAVDDGDVEYRVRTAAALSGDPDYDGLDPDDVSVRNVDDDTAAFVIVPTSGLVTTEAGGTAEFTIALASEPTATVRVQLSSSDSTEGTVSPSFVTFAAATWSTPQTVTAIGADDEVDDGDVPYVIETRVTAGDPTYLGIDPDDVAVTNADNDGAGITVAPTSGLVTTEAGGTAEFTVVLDSEPTAPVTVGLSSADPTEGTASPASLTFTGASWRTAQTVTVTGLDDLVDDGDVAYTIVTTAATTTDPVYRGVDPLDVSVVNLDDDTAGISVWPTALTTSETATFATFNLVLQSQPTANVTIGLWNTDSSEGTITPGAVVFASASWDTPQTVQVRGADDYEIDGDIVYWVVTQPASSADTTYSTMDAEDVVVTNEDDEPRDIEFTGVPNNTRQIGDCTGSTLYEEACPAGEMLVGFDGCQTAPSTGVVGQIAARCGNPTLVGPCTGGGCGVSTTPGSSFPMHGSDCTPTERWSRACPTGSVIVGYRGRSGTAIDQLIFRCAQLAVTFVATGYSLSLGPIEELVPVGNAGGGSPFPAVDCSTGQVATVSRICWGTHTDIDAVGVACQTPELVF